MSRESEILLIPTWLSPIENAKPESLGDRMSLILKHLPAIRKAYPGRIVAVPVGDFFEFFDEDAEVIARELSLTLITATKRGKTSKRMVGFPAWQLTEYRRILRERGYRIGVLKDREQGES